MKKTIESKETFEWELNEGIITAVVTVKNGITEIEEFKVSRKNDGCTFVIKKEVDLIDIHKAMGQLIQEIDKKRGIGSVQLEGSSKTGDEFPLNKALHGAMSIRNPSYQEGELLKIDSEKERVGYVNKSMSSGHDSVQ